MEYMKEQLPCHQSYLGECAELEDIRARQSEVVNMHVVHLQRMVESLLCSPDAPSQGTNNLQDMHHVLATLPADVVDRLVVLLESLEAEQLAHQQRMTQLEDHCVREVEKLETLQERTDKLTSSVAYLSEKSSAEMMRFRTQLSQFGEAARQRARELADIHRKIDKAEMDSRRAEMEIDRLKKIAKRVK